MQKVDTKLDEETIAAIVKRGETVYSFLQKAAKEKLENDRIEKIIMTAASVLTERIGSYKHDSSEALNKNTEYLRKLADAIGQLQK